MKPETPEINIALAEWVKSGGNLIYIGDGSDPYHMMEQAWWNNGEKIYANPAEHLFEMLIQTRTPKNEIYKIGKGQVAIWSIAPAKLTLNTEIASEYRNFIKIALEHMNCEWNYSNQLRMRRGPYIVVEVLNDSCSESPAIYEGLYADLLENGYPIIQKKTVLPNDNAILFDFSKLGDERIRIIGSCARIMELECAEEQFKVVMKAADRINVFTRIRLPKKVKRVEALNQKGNTVPIQWNWDNLSNTVLLNYESQNEIISVEGFFTS